MPVGTGETRTGPLLRMRPLTYPLGNCDRHTSRERRVPDNAKSRLNSHADGGWVGTDCLDPEGPPQAPKAPLRPHSISCPTRIHLDAQESPRKQKKDEARLDC